MLHFFGFSARQNVKTRLFSHLKEGLKIPTMDLNKIKIYAPGNTTADRHNNLLKTILFEGGKVK